MMGLTQVKSNPKIVTMQNTFATAMNDAKLSPACSELDIAIQSLNSSMSFLDEEPEGKSRLAIPVIKTDRAISIDPSGGARRDAFKKSKFAKELSKLSSRSWNEHNSHDGVEHNSNKKGSARLGLTTALQVERKRADSGLSNRSKEATDTSTKDFLNISVNVSTYASTKVSSQASPAHSVMSSYKNSSGQHGYESEEDACFTSAIAARQLKPD